MGKKVKVGKQRRDKFYHLAKEAGFRSRAAFKLIQLNKRFEFLQRSRFLVDLCAAPGGWLQVAAENMPLSSMRIGVDLCPIKAVKGCITLQGDITHEKTRQAIKANLANNEADTVLNDGAPNVGQNWTKDAFEQNCLVLSALKLATQILRRDGYFVTKIFRSADYAALIQTFEKLFKKVHVWKPAASRLESAEIFVVCEKYLKPEKVDPALLDIKQVFVQADTADNNNTTVHRLLAGTKIKKVKALGYEDGDITMFHELKASEFVNTGDPLQKLAAASCIVLDEERFQTHPLTTAELKECIQDIRVCGGAELRKILNWRKKILSEIQKEKLAAEKAAKAHEEPDPEAEEQRELEEIDELIRNATAAEQAKLKKKKREMLKEKRRMQERKQLGMHHEGDRIEEGEDLELFNLSQIQKSLKRKALADEAYERVRAKQAKTGYDTKPDADTTTSILDSEVSDIDVDEEDGEEDLLNDREGHFKRDLIKNNYEGLSEHMKNVLKSYSDKANAKLGMLEDDAVSDEEELEDQDLSDEEDVQETSVKDATSDDEETVIVQDEKKDQESDGDDASEPDDTDSSDDNNSGDENDEIAHSAFVKEQEVLRSDEELDTDDERTAKRTTDDRVKRKRLTPAQLAMGERLIHSSRSRKDVEDWAWNRYSHNDDGLPDWFVEDEKKHCRKAPPVNPKRIAFYRERGRDLNVRPVKAVVEAKMRKKKRQMRRMERAKKRAEGILDNEGMEHAEKVREVRRLYKKAMKPEKKDVKYVRMTKGKRGRVQRPQGGPYKVVDSRLKKDMRAQKANAKREGKKAGKGGRKSGPAGQRRAPPRRANPHSK